MQYSDWSYAGFFGGFSPPCYTNPVSNWKENPSPFSNQIPWFPMSEMSWLKGSSHIELKAKLLCTASFRVVPFILKSPGNKRQRWLDVLQLLPNLQKWCDFWHFPSRKCATVGHWKNKQQGTFCFNNFSLLHLYELGLPYKILYCI